MLPEMWNCPYANESFPIYAEEIPTEDKASDSKDSSYSFIKNLAQEFKLWLVGGSIPEREGDKLFNTSFVFNPKGQLAAKHRKVHLFDIDIPGKMTFKESETLSAGNRVTSFDTPYGRIGLGICYDLRFPEYAQILGQQGCNILLYPGAFNTTTGPKHWELLQRARAVDNQLFVLTCSPARNPESKYQAWGHSSVVNPWGEVVATTEHEPATVYCDLKLDQVDEVRLQIPSGKQKRLDLYNLASLVSSSSSSSSSSSPTSPKKTKECEFITSR